MIYKNLFLTPFRNPIQKQFKTFLASCVSVKPKTDRSRNKINPKINRVNIWQYSLKNNGMSYPVCFKFLLNLLQLSTKGMRVLQGKVQNGDTFEERRKKHENLTK